MSTLALQRERLPMAVILASLCCVLLACAVARLTGYAVPTTAPASAVIASADVTFTDMGNGGVAVRDARSGALVTTIGAQQGGFLRSTMRVLVGQRAAEHIGPEKPFAITALLGNRLQLTDTATGQVLELEAFGSKNVAQFAAILADAEKKS